MNIEKYKDYINKHDLFSVNSGMKLVELKEGYSKVELMLEEDSMNYIGTMHGGLISTMADVAAGTSAVSLGKQVVTLSSNTEYIKAATTGKVIAESRVISKGKTIIRCEVEIHSEDGTVLSKAYITMFITAIDIPGNV